MTTISAEVRGRNRRLGLQLGLVAVLMVVFAAGLWVFGGMLCDWAGIGINNGGRGPLMEAGDGS